MAPSVRLTMASSSPPYSAPAATRYRRRASGGAAAGAVGTAGVAGAAGMGESGPGWVRAGWARASSAVLGEAALLVLLPRPARARLVAPDLLAGAAQLAPPPGGAVGDHDVARPRRRRRRGPRGRGRRRTARRPAGAPRALPGRPGA